MSCPDCPWCCPHEGWIGKALHPVTTEGGDTVLVCRDCADGYAAWLREEACPSEGYDGPYFADTMSGGSILLSP